ncbi:MAG: class I SAM-dependent methyltransferase [Acidobacteriota bacterium]
MTAKRRRPSGRQSRPFYHEFAWAFDLVIDRPVERDCAAIVNWLVERGVVPGSMLLDAGCGTGRYARELGRRGYLVHGIDVSLDLLEEAQRAPTQQAAQVTFTSGNILTLPASRYDAVLCRGVLNDLVDDGDRRSAFASFARALRRSGVLILDVRDWDATVIRKEREPLFRKRVDTSRGKLTFTSVTELDRERHQLIVRESHALEARGRERVVEHEFVMKCWTMAELQSLLDLNGFGLVSTFGAYDPAIGPGATDRLVVVAQLANKS